MNNITYTIPKDLVSSAGNHLGIKVNQLAVYFGFEESSQSIKPENGWEGILPIILKPRNFTGMTAHFEDDSLLFTNIITGEEDAAFCGQEEGNLKIMPMSQMEIIELLSSYLGETEDRQKIKQELSGDALICMLSIADSIKRAKLENILNPSRTEFEITEKILQNEYQYNLEGRNLRWPSVFLAELRWEQKPIDFKKALKELSKVGIIMCKGSNVELSENGEIFFDELLKRKTILGLRSVFYHEGVINYLAMALMRTEKYVWFLDVTDKACIMSLNYEELQGMIGTMISPGEEPLEMEAVERLAETKADGTAKGSAEKNADIEVEAKAKIITISKVKMKAETKAELDSINKDQEKLTPPKFCRNCGEKLTSGSKFCKKCGTKI